MGNCPSGYDTERLDICANADGSTFVKTLCGKNCTGSNNFTGNNNTLIIILIVIIVIVVIAAFVAEAKLKNA